MYFPSRRSTIAAALLNSALIASTNLIGGTTAQWSDLVPSLSDNATFQVSSADDWFEQCVTPFANLRLPESIDISCVDNDDINCPVSNYQLFRKPSGLCMTYLTCAYEECKDPDKIFDLFLKETYNSTTYPEEVWKDDGKFNLPAAVVHPAHVGDVSAAIKYAAEHKIEVSVKTSGHSYTGSSTKKNSLLLNLSKLQKYSPSGSIVECQVDPNIKEGAFQDACNYAIGRNKPAVVRVGGGEVWNELYRSVFIDWNEDEKNHTKYHIVGGAAGTVSAAGGWLASGGLSANGGMRLYGIGADQVLHVEMVLPSGMHVRFGPTKWAKEADKMYPTTTAVTGYCNHGDLSDEEMWDWQECSGDIDFEGLWFAVRGGGGGTYGVITAIYYQLHAYSPLDIVEIDGQPNIFLENKKWYEFLLRFFYLPESVGVTETASNSCSAANTGGFFGGGFYCFNGAGSIMKGAIEKYFSIDADVINIKTWDSYARFSIKEAELKNSNVPKGSALDEGLTLIFPYFASGVLDPSTQEVVIQEDMVFPIDAVVNKLDKMVDMLFECVSYGSSVCVPRLYILGGKIPSADDGMSSLPTHRRHGAFNMMVKSPAWRTKFKQVFYGAEDGKPFVGKSFPGELCHNHVSTTFPTALKDNWTKGCDPRWEEEERKEKCISFQEAAWGTKTLIKLQGIHASVDPDNLFNCWDCVGNAPDLKKGKKRKKNKKGGDKKKKGKKDKAKKGDKEKY